MRKPHLRPVAELEDNRGTWRLLQQFAGAAEYREFVTLDVYLENADKRKRIVCDDFVE